MIEVCSESPGWTMSPRISFSHDLAQPDGIPIDRQRSDSSLLDSSPDFDFCINDSFQEESSSADELFSDGKILPILPRSNSREIYPSKPPKHPISPPTPPPTPPPVSSPVISETKQEEPKKESLREIMATRDPPAGAAEEKSATSKSFWRFTRSSSLNCGTGYKRSLICKLPLLNRSNSTGSVTQNPKKEANKSSQKQKPLSSSQPSQPPSTSSSSSSSSLPKPITPPLKKNERGHRPGAYGNGVRISPVLNVPPPYISTGTSNLFGFGYLFRTGKDGSKSRKKTTAS